MPIKYFKNYFDWQTQSLWAYRSGQVLVEILAAFVLLTFLLSGLIVAGLYAISNIQYARNKSQATVFASQQMERVRVKRDMKGIGVLPSCSNPCFLNPQLTFGPTNSSGIFTQSLQIVTPKSGVECPTPTGGPPATIYKAVVDVAWGNIPGGVTPRQVELNSCFSNWR